MSERHGSVQDDSASLAHGYGIAAREMFGSSADWVVVEPVLEQCWHDVRVGSDWGDARQIAFRAWSDEEPDGND